MDVLRHWLVDRPGNAGTYEQITIAEESNVEPCKAQGWRVQGPYVPESDLRGAVDALREAREQMTDPSTGSARPNCLAPRMSVDRALATLGGQ